MRKKCFFKWTTKSRIKPRRSKKGIKEESKNAKKEREKGNKDKLETTQRITKKTKKERKSNVRSVCKCGADVCNGCNFTQCQICNL